MAAEDHRGGPLTSLTRSRNSPFAYAKSVTLGLLFLTPFIFGETASAIARSRIAKPKANHSTAAASEVSHYTVSFAPTGATPIIFRNEQGAEIGRAEDEALLEIEVSPEVMREATTQRGVDIRKLIQALPAMSTNRGPFARLKVPIEVNLTNGRRIRPHSDVLVDLNSFAKLGTVQPVGAWSGGKTRRSEEPDAIDGFNHALEANGVDGIEEEVPLRPQKKQADRVSSQDWYQSSLLNGGRFLTSPTCSCRKASCYVTSNFGHRKSVRTRNGRRSSSNHAGLDIGGGAGTPIVAAADGCVGRLMTNRRAGYGLTVQLKHGRGFMTQYSHLQRFAPGVREGKCFKRGDLIGYMGSTGNSTGPHLHFGVYRNNRPVNPVAYLAPKNNRSLSMSCGTLKASLESQQRSSLAALTKEPRSSSSRSRGQM